MTTGHLSTGSRHYSPMTCIEEVTIFVAESFIENYTKAFRLSKSYAYERALALFPFVTKPMPLDIKDIKVSPFSDKTWKLVFFIKRGHLAMVQFIANNQETKVSRVGDTFLLTSGDISIIVPVDSIGGQGSWLCEHSFKAD